MAEQPARPGGPPPQPPPRSIFRRFRAHMTVRRKPGSCQQDAGFSKPEGTARMDAAATEASMLAGTVSCSTGEVDVDVRPAEQAHADQIRAEEHGEPFEQAKGKSPIKTSKENTIQIGGASSTAIGDSDARDLNGPNFSGCSMDVAATMLTTSVCAQNHTIHARHYSNGGDHASYRSSDNSFKPHVSSTPSPSKTGPSRNTVDDHASRGSSGSFGPFGASTASPPKGGPHRNSVASSSGRTEVDHSSFGSFVRNEGYISPPTGASCGERLRDQLLRSMTYKCFWFLVLVWAVNVAGWGAWAGWLLFIKTDMPEGNDDLATGEEVWDTEHNWINLCTHIEIGLFSCFNLSQVPWRWGNMFHLWCPKWPNAVGLDLYGRPTGAIWYHIPHVQRKRIVFMNLLSVAFHVVLQAEAIVWRDYESSHEELPGTLLINLALVGTIGFGVLGGVYQGITESKLRKAHPTMFAPAINFYMARAWKDWRKGGHGSLMMIVRREHASFVADRLRHDALHRRIATTNRGGAYPSISEGETRNSQDSANDEERRRRVERASAANQKSRRRTTETNPSCTIPDLCPTDSYAV